MWRNPDRILECAREMAGGQAAFPCELGEWDLSVQIGLDDLFGTTLLPWCETAARRQRLQATICLCNVASKCQHRPINKQSVGLIRSIQCRIKRKRQCPHSRVIDSA